MFKKLLALMLCVLLLMSTCAFALAAEGDDEIEVEGCLGVPYSTDEEDEEPPVEDEEQVETWYSAAQAKFLELGAIFGEDDIESAATRSKMVSIFNISMGYIKDGTARVTFENVQEFADIAAGSPYRDDFLIARATGFIQGDENNCANPEKLITRSEVAVIIARVMGLDLKNKSIPSGYADDARIADWARPSIVALTEAGYFRGDNYRSFNPSAPITLAETVVLLDRVLGDIIVASTVVDGAEFAGNVTVIGENVVLRNVKIAGSLIISQAAGTVSLDKADIGGDLIYK